MVPICAGATFFVANWMLCIPCTATVIDQTVMNDMLTEICKALLQAEIST